MTILIAVHFCIAALAPVLMRLLGSRAYWLLALPSLVAFVWLLAQAPLVINGGSVTETFPWIPSLGIALSFQVSTLQWVMGLIVTGVGTMVLLYCRWYFGGGDPAVRTGGVLTAFAGAMLGLVLSNDLIGLYIFWELTTVFSYLLVGGYNPSNSANRQAASTALIVTTFGGLSMLVGILMLGFTSGTFQLSELFDSPAIQALLADPAQASPTIIVAVLLLLVGAITKSAQIPFHFWLPGAMAAPTPVSAYLHAAAMVKAGIYLALLLAPVFAAVPGWRHLLLPLGAITMLLGGFRALRQHDIKVLLAYGTVSQLGFLMFFAGLGTRSAMLAGLALVVSHALFKSALFLVVGVVDRSAGTRDIRKLSGIGRTMPVTAGAAIIAGASMAGIPPLLGFATKEAAFESLEYLVATGDGTGIPPLSAALLAGALILGSALTVAYTLRFLWGTFATDKASEISPPPPPTKVTRPSAGFLFAPVVLASLSLIGGFLGPQMTAVFEPYVALGSTGEPSHGIALWHGFSIPLAMSAVALGVGAIMFVKRARIEQLQVSMPEVPDARDIYQLIMRTVDRVAVDVTARTQRGSLPLYLGTILVVFVTGASVVLFTTGTFPSGIRPYDSIAQLVVGVFMIVAAILASTARGRMKAAILAGVVGYGCALMFMFHGAPDLALTQTLVETVTLVILVLVLRKLPKYFTSRPLQSTRWWRLVVAAVTGLVISASVVYAAGSRVDAPLSEAFPELSYDFGFGNNIVNVTLVDIRAWDTLNELSVLVVAATGVASLIFIRTRNAELSGITDRRASFDERRRFRREGRAAGAQGSMVWLRGGTTLSPMNRSVVFEVMTRLLFGVIMVASVYFLVAGHNLPGGGFAGGLIAGVALAIRYLAGGRNELDEAAPVDAGRLLGGGLLLAGLSLLAPAAFGGRIGESYRISLTLDPLIAIPTPFGSLPLLGEPYLVTSMIFDIGVYLVVVGVLLDLIRSLGAGIDQQEDEHRTPSPRVTTGTREFAAGLRGNR